MLAKIPGKISMSAPDITDAEVAAVNQVLASNTLSIGPRLVEFEEKLASYVGVNYAIGVSSGTAGLHLCMIAEGVGENDLVITPSFSFIASANSILYERAAPIFVDVDPTTGNIDPHQAAEAVHDLMKGGRFAERWLPRTLHGNSEAYRLKALLPVHAFGQPADMDSLLDIARHYHLSVIEDACEAIGSQYKGRIVGTLGDSAVFAFYPNKQMTTGEGGMIVTNSNGKANLIRSLRNQGRDVFDAWLNHTRLGYNYRMDEMSAALGAVQIARIDELLAKRAEVAQWYHERLKNIEWIDRPIVTPETTRMSWFVYVIKIKPPFNRDEVMNDLAEVGIPCRPYFTPIHLQPFYRGKFGYRRGDLPNTEYLGDVSLALPFSSVITEEQVEYISQQIKKLESWSGKVTATEAAKAVGAQAFIAPPPPLQNSSGGTIDTSQELDEILHSPSRNSWWNRLLTRHLQYIGDATTGKFIDLFAANHADIGNHRRQWLRQPGGGHGNRIKFNGFGGQHDRTRQGRQYSGNQGWAKHERNSCTHPPHADAV